MSCTGFARDSGLLAAARGTTCNAAVPNGALLRQGRGRMRAVGVRWRSAPGRAESQIRGSPARIAFGARPRPGDRGHHTCRSVRLALVAEPSAERALRATSTRWLPRRGPSADVSICVRRRGGLGAFCRRVLCSSWELLRIARRVDQPVWLVGHGAAGPSRVSVASSSLTSAMISRRCCRGEGDDSGRLARARSRRAWIHS